MIKYKNIFVNEDISKPENRLNLAIFHLQIDSEFHSWFCSKLGLADNCIIYPKTNQSGVRPDYYIKENSKDIAVVEVELGNEDLTQLKNYKEKFLTQGLKVFSISGLSKHSSDLSLEEIRTYLLNRNTNLKSEQTRVSFEYLIALINTYKNSHKHSKRTDVSEEVLKRPIVYKLLQNLKEYKPLENQNRPEPSRFYIDTNGPQGFSFRVFSDKGSKKSISLLSISGGRDYFTFLSAQKYRDYLKHKDEIFVNNWINFIIQELKTPIDKKKYLGRVNISINIIESNFDKLIKNIKPLI